MELPANSGEKPQRDFRLPKWDLYDAANDYSEKPTFELLENKEEGSSPERDFQQAFAKRGAMEITGSSGRILEPQKAAEYREHLAVARQELIESFPSETEGLNLDWGEEYIDGLGLHVMPTIVIPREAKSDWDNEVGFFGKQEPTRTDASLLGRYYPNLDLGVMFRNKDEEEIFGPELTESLILHEKMHGTQSPPYISVEPATGIVDMENGCRLMDDVLDHFLEEGFSEMHTVRASIQNNINGSRGSVSYDPLVTEFLPSKYIYPEKGGHLATTPSYPAAALEALIEADPEIDTALIEYRKDPAKNREIIARINAIDPAMMDNLSYDSPVWSLNYVLRRLGKI
jgi:hypothetical protein